MSRNVAIVTTEDRFYNHGDDYETITRSITDWTLVDDKDFEILKKAVYRNSSLLLLEQPVNQSAFIAKTVADYIEKEKQLEAAAVIEKQRRQDTALARKHKKELKDRESKIALLKKLQAELGPV